ncbi:hypothetical protein K8R32_05105 [bacterium]|nr:hypothetical protein [bacterium]
MEINSDLVKMWRTNTRFYSLLILCHNAGKSRGTTFNNYVDVNGNKGEFVSMLKVYGRGGKKCKKCASIIKKLKVAGRGTHYCPNCQK